MIKIVRAETESQCQQVRELMAEYIQWDGAQTKQLGLDAQAFLDFYYDPRNQELPGEFSPPDGCLLLATVSEKAAGCGAFHRLTAESCEMKRIYVRPEFRGLQIGRRLVETLVETAQEAGYRTMRLETTTFMDKAIALYTSLGFQTCGPYYVIPESFRGITVFMELDIATAKWDGKV